jgi:hypothetical protein
MFVAALHWHEAARVDIGLGGSLPVRCLCSDARGYGVIYRNADHAGQDALIVTRNGARVEDVAACFDSIERLEPMDVHQGGAPILELRLYRGRSFAPHRNGRACGLNGTAPPPPGR